jgi:urea transporter
LASLTSSLRASGVVRAVDTTLVAYAQILLSRSRVAGLLLFVATASDPRSLVFGALCLMVAAGVVRLLSIDGPAIDGPYGYNALLLGLGVAHTYGATPRTIVLAIALAVTCVIVTAFFCSWFGRTGGLPVLSLPFVLVFTLALGAAPYLGLVPLLESPQTASETPFFSVLSGLGAIVFVPQPFAGLLVVAALIVHSRIATLLAAMACALSCGFVWAAAVPSQLVPLLVMNAVLSAMALGGIWFIPSAASFAVAAASAVVCLLISTGLFAPLAQLGIPLLVLPFNVAVVVVLAAMRQRGRDERPKAVDFAPGSPEENLLYFQSNIQRRLGPKKVSFQLPFRGAWTCTQGNSGAITHKGLWRYAYDFEVIDDAGSPLLSAAGIGCRRRHSRQSGQRHRRQCGGWHQPTAQLGQSGLALPRARCLFVGGPLGAGHHHRARRSARSPWRSARSCR